MSSITISGQNRLTEPKKCIGSLISPSDMSTEFTVPPSRPSMLLIMPYITTQDMKCGRYDTACTTDLTLDERISFSISANIIGAGKPNMIFANESTNVFVIIVAKLP